MYVKEIFRIFSSFFYYLSAIYKDKFYDLHASVNIILEKIEKHNELALFKLFSISSCLSVECYYRSKYFPITI